MSYTPHTIDTAPAAARETLAGVNKSYGFVPNLMGVMAEAPALLRAYRTIVDLFDETSLNPTERQIVLLTTSYENRCEYCVAAHSVIAGMQQVPEAVVQAIRSGQPIDNPRLEALRRFTAAIVVSRGWPSDEEKAAFANAGYDKAQALEVVLGVSVKTLSNYTNHIADTPLDRAFAKAAWSKAA
ncbi:MAG: carboxymuconolactone decarboxylase family protein [Vicinamibacterales bacterium]